MAKIRVLIVDDSVVIRRLLSDCLAGDADIEVVGTASNGRLGLAKIPQLNPDLVTLDIEMPGLSGLETVAEIRKSHPRLPVIMFSTLTERGAAITLEALSLGARDYVTKPSNTGGIATSMERVRGELIPKIKALCHKAPLPPLRPTVFSPSSPLASRARSIALAAGPPEIVAIGVSTGGPNALAEVLPRLPQDLRVPIVIVQHMPPVFTRLLSERLRNASQIDVQEGAAGSVLKPGAAWIAPGGKHMVVERSGVEVRLALSEDAPENSCRPAADVLFRSVVASFGGRVLGVVMTGMGQDGFRGCELIREAGGHVVVQDEESSVVWGMPGYVARAGLADKVLPLSDIAGEITARTQGGAGRFDARLRAGGLR
jgi:two-component system, chemotaxis family, protein-glutamate methylesterase/glutaminase